MLIDATGTIRPEAARPDGDRAEKRRLIAIALSLRAAGDPEGWLRVAERIGALVPDLNLLM
jgi:hypothetical protein